MTTLRVGIASASTFKAHTLAIARGEHKVTRDEPKVWFTSIESMAKGLSEKNRSLLAIIADEQPVSLQALAERTGRAKPNLSRTLKTMANYGLIRLEKGEGRALAPRALYSDIRLDLPLHMAA